MDFRWNAWNVDHVAAHGIEPEEAEFVVSRARPPFPESAGEGKFRVWGQSAQGRYIQVVFVPDADGETAYVIHARPLTESEKRRLRRRRR